MAETSFASKVVTTIAGAAILAVGVAVVTSGKPSPETCQAAVIAVAPSVSRAPQAAPAAPAAPLQFVRFEADWVPNDPSECGDIVATMSYVVGTTEYPARSTHISPWSSGEPIQYKGGVIEFFVQVASPPERGAIKVTCRTVLNGKVVDTDSATPGRAYCGGPE